MFNPADLKNGRFHADTSGFQNCQLSTQIVNCQLSIVNYRIFPLVTPGKLW